MSIMYCEYCHKMVDTDYFPEHFSEDGICERETEFNAFLKHKRNL